nr:30S small subunit ribosomal protein S21e [Kwoniella mangroviensis CBS 8507]OCF67527.1 30S small subunit ribosomal protein S21e [Kwoniella mangroviensis CBS 8507]
MGMCQFCLWLVYSGHENDKGVLVDLYIPRHCSATGRLITANDHASIQIQVADVDADGKAIKGQGQTIAICGRIRAQGDSDDSINRIATKQGRECNSSLRTEEEEEEWLELEDQRRDWILPILYGVDGTRNWIRYRWRCASIVARSS